METMSKRSNEQWLVDLSVGGEAQAAALDDLRLLILRGLPYALSPWLGSSDPRLAPLVEEAAQEALLRVLDHLNEFQGRSQFTTWVHTIAVRVALTELRRKHWENVSLEELLEEDETNQPPLGLVADPSPGPEQLTEKSELARRVRRIIAEELSEKQRRALIALAVQGMPMEEAARRLGTNRNALYKLLHDARLRLKKRLAAEGVTISEALETFG